MAETKAFTNWQIPPEAEWRPQWEEALGRHGIAIEIDDSWREQLMLCVAICALSSPGKMPVLQICQLLLVPVQLRSRPGRIIRWVVDRWHKPWVRHLMRQHLRTHYIMHPIMSAAPSQEAILAALEKSTSAHNRQSAWLQAAWSVQWAPDERVAGWVRDLFGAEEWDQVAAQFEAELRPRLVWALLGSQVQQIRQQLEAKEHVRLLHRRARQLTWQTDTETTKEQKAVARIAELEQLIGAAHQELTELEQALPLEQTRTEEELDTLLQAVAEERLVWQELLAESRTGPEIAVPKPLAGRRVVLVGGDPMAASASAILRALGAERVEACPGFTEQRRFAQVVEGADLAVAVTAYMDHSHSDLLRQAMARTDLQVVWVNHSGLHALRRALQEAAPAVMG